MLISILFSLLAYRNVRHLVQSRIRIQRRRLDRQMTAMIFARVIFFVLFLFPQTVNRISQLNIDLNQVEPFSRSIFQWFSTISGFLHTLVYAVSFSFFYIQNRKEKRINGWIFSQISSCFS